MAGVKAEHLRVSDDERILVDAAEEAAFLNSFSSIDADSLSDDTWRTNKTVDSSSDLDSLDDILDNSSSSKEPIPKPNTTKPTQDHSVKEPTAATAAPASGGSASEPLVATKPAGSDSAGSATETPTSTSASFAASTSGASTNDDASSVTDTPATEAPTDVPGIETPTSTTTTDVPTTDTPMSDATVTPNTATNAPAATEEPTSTTTVPSSDASSSGSHAPTEPAGSDSAGSATETPTSTSASFTASTSGASTNDDASSVTDTPATEAPTDVPGIETPTSTTTTDVPTTDTPMSDATDTPNAAANAPAATEAPTSTTAVPSVTEPNGTPSNPPVLVGTTTETPATETPSTSPMNSDQLSQVGAWEQCGGLGFDYAKYFADGISPIWQLVYQATLAAVVTSAGRGVGIPADAAERIISRGSFSGDRRDDAGIVKSGDQIVDVSGAQACGGEGFNYSRFSVGPMPDGNVTKLKCVPGFRCEVDDSSPTFWCKQYALPLNAKCGGYMFYTLFKCIDGTACTIDPERYEPRCLSTLPHGKR
ncbi:hypothetical protein PInf_018325 [Phytophthora infestans]|nr:hypothetical protein PInf_018325 [Phytophthora infestans]